jgi:hypothetical protein
MAVEMDGEEAAFGGKEGTNVDIAAEYRREEDGRSYEEGTCMRESAYWGRL